MVAEILVDRFFCKYFLVLALVPLVSTPAIVTDIEKAKEEISIQEKLGNSVFLNGSFTDENGQTITLRDYFRKNQKPVIITPVYYTCPHLCDYIFQGLVDAINQENKYVLGRDYKILSISMNHQEQPEQAKYRKEESFKKIPLLNDLTVDFQKKQMMRQGWSLLTGTKENIRSFYDSVGFRYKKQEREYAHTASLIFATPKGEIARYLYGIRYEKNDFRLAILEASQGKISSFVDQVFFFCFQYNAAKRVYSLVAWRVMTLGGGLTAIFLIGFLSFLWFQERRGKRNQLA